MSKRSCSYNTTDNGSIHDKSFWIIRINTYTNILIFVELIDKPWKKSNLFLKTFFKFNKFLRAHGHLFLSTLSGLWSYTFECETVGHQRCRDYCFQRRWSFGDGKHLLCDKQTDKLTIWYVYASSAWSILLDIVILAILTVQWKSAKMWVRQNSIFYTFT